MRTVTEVVGEIINSSDTALEALREGLLNRTAFAKQIQKRVGDKLLKEVPVNTIVVALSRIEKQLGEIPALKPQVSISGLNIKSPLSEITFEKTQVVLEELRGINLALLSKSGYFNLTEGSTEITLICSQENKQKISAHFKSKPKSHYDDLTAATITFPVEYLPIPNVIYTFISTLAAKRINLIEVVSTYTELTFVFESRDTDRVVSALQPYFYKK